MSHFLFLRPAWLLALPLVIGFHLFLRRLARTPERASPWRNQVDAPLLAELLQASHATKPGRGSRLWILAWCLAVVILAGPSWRRLPPPRFQPAAPPLALLVELPEEMDERETGRLQALLATLLERMPARPLSLWIYGRRAWRVMPATEDFRLLERLTAVLSPRLLPVGGTSLERALDEVAASQRRRGRPGEILVVAGRAPPGAIAAAGRLRSRGHRIWALARGSPAEGLRRLAEAGGGADSTPERLAELARALSPPRYRAAAEEGGPVPVDDGPWLLPLLLALTLLLFRRGAVLLCVAVAVLPPPAPAGWQALFLNEEQQGWRALQKGEPHLAARLFHDPLWRGIALYRAGRYADAAAQFERLDSALAHYNRGNALVRLGRLKAARKAYQAALERDPGLRDAGYNLELVEQALAERVEGTTRRKGARGRGEGGGLLAARRRPSPSRPAAALPRQGKGKGGGERRAQAPERRRQAPPRRSGAGSAKGVSAAAAARRRAPQERSPADSPPPPSRSERKGTSGTKRGEKKETRGRRTTDREERLRAPPAERRARRAGGPDETPSAGARNREERMRETEVWLQSVQDDPAELLRALFRAQRREGAP